MCTIMTILPHRFSILQKWPDATARISRSVTLEIGSPMTSCRLFHPVSTEHHILKQAVQPYENMPGPRPLPFIGNSWRFLPYIGQYSVAQLDVAMKDLHRQYGRVAKLSGLVGHPDLVFVFDPDIIQQIFRLEERMPRRPSMPTLHYYKLKMRKEFFQDTPGVIGVHGELWEKFRGQVNQVMLNAKAARSYTRTLDDIAHQFVNTFETLLDDNRELPQDFLDQLYKWSLESFGAVALGTRFGCLQAEHQQEDRTKRILEAVRSFFKTVTEVELRKPYARILNTREWKSYVAALDIFREECMRRIDESLSRKDELQSGSEDPIVRKIIKKTNNPRLGSILALDLMLVGLDTSSVSAITCLYFLARNSKSQKRLHQELHQLLPDANSPITNSVLDRMHYMKACIREALRIYPVIIGNGRSLSSETVIGGYEVPKGTHIIFPHLITGNDAKNGFPEPHKYLPERWLHGADADAGCPVRGKLNSADKPHPFGSLPFGFGRRMCLGRRFAELQLQLLLAKIIRRYQVEYHYSDFEYEISPVYVPKNPLKFRLLKRSDQE